MSAPLSAVAIVPARAGSKGLPGKNVRPLLGLPLAAWTLDAARAARRVRRVVTTTDDPVVAALARSRGATVVDRPAELAGDGASIVEATLHAAAAAGLSADDAIVLLQPTSPLRAAEDIDAAVALFERGRGRGSVMSVSELEHHPLKALLIDAEGALHPVSGQAETLSAARQSLPRAVRQNGAVYVIRLAELKAGRSFFAAPCLAYPMPPDRSEDIDDLDDFRRCEAILAARAG